MWNLEFGIRESIRGVRIIDLRRTSVRIPNSKFLILNSRPAGFEGERPRLERLAVRAEDAVDEFDLHGAKALERVGEFQFEDAVERGVLKGEIGRRRRRLTALDALGQQVAGADVILQGRRIEIARELDP